MQRILSLYKQAFSNLQPNIWILSIAMFINRSGAMVLLFTSLYLTNDLHFSIAQAGLTMGFFGIGSVLGSYAGGWLTDRKNFFDIMLLSLIASGLILPLMLFATTQVEIAAIIFSYAFASDMFRPANSAAIAEYSISENRTRSVSLVRLAINLGFSIGPAIGGFVALHLGYKWLFVIDASTSFGTAAMLFLYLPRHKRINSHQPGSALLDSRTSAYRDYHYLLFIFLVSVFGLSFFQLFATIPQYFNKVCKYDEDTIGLLLALNGLIVVLFEMPLVTWLGKRKNIFLYIIAGTLCLPVAFLILRFGQGLVIVAVIYTIFITLAEVFAMPFMMNYTLSRPNKERQGQYSALYSIAYGIANIAAPSLGLWIASRYNFNFMFYFFIVLSLLAALGFNWLRKREL